MEMVEETERYKQAYMKMKKKKNNNNSSFVCHHCRSVYWANITLIGTHPTPTVGDTDLFIMVDARARLSSSILYSFVPLLF